MRIVGGIAIQIYLDEIHQVFENIAYEKNVMYVPRVRLLVI